MTRTNRPRSGRTTLHRDGTVTVWNCLKEQWERGSEFPDALYATLSESERALILRHVGDAGA